MKNDMIGQDNIFKKLIKSAKNFLFKSNVEASPENEAAEVDPFALKTGNEKVDKSTSIGDLMTANPEMDDVLYEYGLHCGSCFAASFDTLEEGAKMHGLEDDEVEELVQEINKKIEAKKAAASVAN